MKVLTFHLCGGGGSLLSQISLSSSICCDENIGPTIFSDLGCQLVVIVYPFFNKRVKFKKMFNFFQNCSTSTVCCAGCGALTKKTLRAFLSELMKID